MKRLIFFFSIFLMWLFMVSCSDSKETNEDILSIRPYVNNPFYWQYKGKPILLLGGSWQDNLFNHPAGLEEHLDKLTESGGNYVRNTMSHRNEGNAFAFSQKNGKFDLNEFNPEYWQRFENFLKLTAERDIIVQIEIFDAWDNMEDHQSLGGWSKNPFNPSNNINYTSEESRLPVEIKYRPGEKSSGHAFYRTVPDLDNNELVLEHQKEYVDKLMSISIKFPNVLYCIQNESGEELAFGDYWIRYIRKNAQKAGKKIFTTDMRRNNDITASDHSFIYQNPELYTFVDISQNNSQNVATGQLHWERIQMVREILKQQGIRPMNNIKIYSREEGEPHINGPQRFWRIITGGCASARFHRPHPLEGGPENHYKLSMHGLGLHPQAQANIASARKFLEAIHIFSCKPDNELLEERSENEAYCVAEERKQYGIYFPEEGAVVLNLSNAGGKWQLRWLDISEDKWLDEKEIYQGGVWIPVETPGIGHCVAVILPVENEIGENVDLKE